MNPALYVSEICDTEDINGLLLGKCDIGRWLLGNQLVHMETDDIIRILGVNLGGVGMIIFFFR